MGSDLALVAAQLPNCGPSARWISMASRRSLWALLFALSLGTWGQSAKEPVTLTYFRLGWFQPDEPQEANAWERWFMQETASSFAISRFRKPLSTSSIYRKSFSKIVTGRMCWV